MPNSAQPSKSTSKKRSARRAVVGEPSRDDIAASIEAAIRSQLGDLNSIDANALARLTIALERIERRNARRGKQPDAAASAADIESARAEIAASIEKLTAAEIAADPLAVRRRLRRSLAEISRRITRERDADRKRVERASRDQLHARLLASKQRRQRASSVPATASSKRAGSVPAQASSKRAPTVTEVQDAFAAEQFSPPPKPLSRG